MASKRQSMDRAPTASDLISDLPADIIMNILLRLPLQEAVRTSLLSKEWRYKWITIPHLIFNPLSFSPVPKISLQVDISDALAIIHQVLLQHEGPVSKFELDVRHLRSSPEIDHLISLLSGENIEEFTLMWKGNHKIPSHLFSFLKMRLLGLQGCVLNPPPPDFAGFARLTNLELLSVDLPASFAETFVARCPLLQCLKLLNCTNLDSVDFYAPNLQGLDYLGSISSISFKNTPSLKKVYICDVSLESSNHWIDTFCSLPSLEHLQLGCDFNLMLGDKLASPLNCLVSLALYIFGDAALSLIKSSPNLQKLKLFYYIREPFYYIREEYNAEAIQISEAKETWEGSWEKLQSIEISDFSGLKSQMALIELLLAKSPMLETVHVFYRKGWSGDKKSSALEKIHRVPRASPRAEVIFSLEKS